MQDDSDDPTQWYSEDAATFGDRLAAAREAKAMDQATLARRLGVSKATVAAWENDRREPRGNRLDMLSGMLGVSIGWLVTGRGRGAPAPIAALEADGADARAAELAGELAEIRGVVTRLASQIERLERRLSVEDEPAA